MHHASPTQHMCPGGHHLERRVKHRHYHNEPCKDSPCSHMDRLFIYLRFQVAAFQPQIRTWVQLKLSGGEVVQGICRSDNDQ
jgi:hypothetical protein